MKKKKIFTEKGGENRFDVIFLWFVEKAVLCTKLVWTVNERDHMFLSWLKALAHIRWTKSSCGWAIHIHIAGFWLMHKTIAIETVVEFIMILMCEFVSNSIVTNFSYISYILCFLSFFCNICGQSVLFDFFFHFSYNTYTHTHTHAYYYIWATHMNVYDILHLFLPINIWYVHFILNMATILKKIELYSYSTQMYKYTGADLNFMLQ